MSKNRWSVLGLALGVLVLGVLVGLMTIGIVAADPTPGIRIQLPRIDLGDVLGTGDWDTWIQVQNVSHDVDTGVIVFAWGEYSGLCPSNAPGPIHHYCQLIRGNGLWTLKDQLSDDAIKSAIVYSVPADVFQEACDAADWAEGDTHRWLEWEQEWRDGTGVIDPPFDTWGDPAGAQGGEELAVTVTRYGPNDHGTFVSSTYTGISEEMEGEDHPWEYYAPYVMKGYNGLDTELTIQNSGLLCTSVWIHYKEQESCTRLYDQHIEQLAPGESVQVRVPCNTGEIPCFWLGSAHISAEQPLGIIVDETSFEEPCLGPDPGTLLTHRARPKVELRDGEVITDTRVYADLLFREWSGWDASIQVQNLSRTGQNTFVTVDFMDNSGDEILFLADWVCPGNSETFYLPIVTDLGRDYVGAAEIESHDQVSFPGDVTPSQPIFAVVDLKRPDNPLTPELDAQGGSYNAHPYSQKEWVSEIALPFVAKDAQDTYPQSQWTSLIAIRNNSNCNKIKPRIWFKIETGELVCDLPISWLHPKHVKLIDLNEIGCLWPGYVGSAKVIVEDWEQLCDVDNDGHVDNKPFMPSVIVVEKGLPFGGDVTNIYEGIPYAKNIPPCYGDILGKVHSIDPGEDPGFDAAEPIWLPDQDPQGVTVSRVVFEEAPFSVSGYAYMGEDCGLLTLERLAGAHVELQAFTCQAGADDECDGDPDDDWEWLVVDDTTTTSDGFFAFLDALDLEGGEDPAVWEDGDETLYQLTLYLETNGTVSYKSDEFNDAGNWEVNFRIETVNGGLDLTSGTWCDPRYIRPAVIERPSQATTNSTGDYEMEDVVAGTDLVVEFAALPGFLPYYTLVDLDCGEDEVLDAELLCLGEVGLKVVTSIATDTVASTVSGAKVTYSKPYGEKAAHYAALYGDYFVTSGETDNTGVLTLTVPILNATGTFTVSAPGIAETGVFTWTQMVNTPTDRTTCVNCGDSIFGGDVHNSRVLTPTANIPDDLVNAYMWYGFDDGSCANINSASRFLNNQDVELVLCGFGTVSGRVTVGVIAAAGRLVEVIMNGVVVGTDTTDANGNYIIEDIPTGCFSTDCTVAGNAPFTVRVMGSTKNGDWEGCGDVERVDFPF